MGRSPRCEARRRGSCPGRRAAASRQRARHHPHPERRGGHQAVKIGELHNALVQIKSHRKNLGKGFYDIGNILKDIQIRKLYEAKGYGSFEAFLEREIDLGKVTSLRLVKIVATFVKDAALEYGMDRTFNAMVALETIAEDNLGGQRDRQQDAAATRFRRRRSASTALPMKPARSLIRCRIDADPARRKTRLSFPGAAFFAFLATALRP